MGQYYFITNVDRKEFLDPFKLGSGMKAWEQLANDMPSKALMVLVLSSPQKRGGGDLQDNPAIGRWAGDRIIMVGDYAEEGDHTTIPVQDIFSFCSKYETEAKEHWVDITELVIPVLEKELEVKAVVSGSGYDFVDKKGTKE